MKKYCRITITRYPPLFDHPEEIHETHYIHSPTESIPIKFANPLHKGEKLIITVEKISFLTPQSEFPPKSK